jgi:hypothetical protein
VPHLRRDQRFGEHGTDLVGAVPQQQQRPGLGALRRVQQGGQGGLRGRIGIVHVVQSEATDARRPEPHKPVAQRRMQPWCRQAGLRGLDLGEGQRGQARQLRLLWHVDARGAPRLHLLQQLGQRRVGLVLCAGVDRQRLDAAGHCPIEPLAQQPSFADAGFAVQRHMHALPQRGLQLGQHRLALHQRVARRAAQRRQAGDHRRCCRRSGGR